MGYSWAIAASLTIPGGRLAELKAHEIQPADLRNAPPGWGSPNERTAMTVASVIDLLQQEDLFEVTWSDDGMRAHGVVSNDSSTWSDLRSHIVAAIRAAPVAGGRGEIAITSWVDATPGTAFFATAEPGGSSFRVLRGDDARTLEERVHGEVNLVLDRLFEARTPATPVKLDFAAPVQALHRDVLAALRALPAERVHAAAARRDEPWPSPNGLSTLAPLATTFPSGGELLEALGSGFRNLHQPAALLGFALELLTELDPARASELGRRALEMSPLPPAPMRMAAEAVDVRLDSEAELTRAIAIVREKLRISDAVHLEHPILRRVRAAERLLALPAVRRALAGLVGGPTVAAPFTQLDDQSAAFGKMLTFVLRHIGTADDLPLLLPLWAGLSHPRLAAFDLAWEHGGEAAKPVFAALFGVEAPDIDYGHLRQRYALRALYELDPDALFSKVHELVAAPSLTREQGHAIGELVELASAPGTAWSSAWERALRAIAARYGEHAWAQQAELALLSHGDPTAVAWALEKLAAAAGLRDARSIETLLGALEKSGEASVAPRLRELAAALDKRGKNRVEKAIAKLEGAAAETPAGHHIGVSPSARAACRACKEKIAKGVLRFGESVPNAFTDSGEPTYRWFHLACAAEKKPALFSPVLASYTGELPERAELLAVLDAKLAKKKKR
jgi:hypothetical protein